MKRLGLIVAFCLWASSALAGVGCSLPFTLTNGTTADASQVMANYNAIITCLGNAAAAGNNSDITSLSGLTTPIAPGSGGTPVFVGNTSTGSANAQVVSATTPSSFSLTRNYAIVFTAGFTNTGATQFNVNGTGLTNVYRQTPNGPQALTGGEIILNNLVVAIYDGTEFQLISSGPQFGGFGPQVSVSVGGTLADLGSVPTHNVNIQGSGNIASFGSSASTTYPIYFLTFPSTFTILQNQSLCSTNGNCIALPGGANITTAVGDTAIALYLGVSSGGGGNWQIVSYTPAAIVPGNLTVVTPQGYLTLLPVASGGPIMGSSDITAATAVYYSPYTGNQIAIWNGTALINYTFAELTCTLNSSSQSASGIYDVFIFNNAGVITCVFGPAWSTATPGSGARGTATALVRKGGLLVNNLALTANNGASSYTVPINQGTYVGSIFVDSSAGQVSAYRTWGSSRKFGVWNAYNRVPICLIAGDSTASWTYGSATIRESRGQTTNTLAVFSGLAEEQYAAGFIQQIQIQAGANSTATVSIGVGYNSTTSFSGQVAVVGPQSGTGTTVNLFGTPDAHYVAPPSLGVNNVNSLEATSGATGTFTGTNPAMQLSACWRG